MRRTCQQDVGDVYAREGVEKGLIRALVCGEEAGVAGAASTTPHRAAGSHRQLRQGCLLEEACKQQKLYPEVREFRDYASQILPGILRSRGREGIETPASSEENIEG